MSKITINRLGADMGTVSAVCNDPRYLYKAVTFVREAAQGKARGGESGKLKASISATVEQDADGLTGHVGTNIKYAMYVEFGTGPRGAASHAGISPDFDVTYVSEPWYIPADEVDTNNVEATAARYHWQEYNRDGKTFYRTYGSAAHPFLYPALKDNEAVVGDMLTGGWEKAIRGAVK